MFAVVMLALPCLAAAAQTTDARSLLDQMEYSTDAVSPNRFVAAHGQRAILMGYPQDGLEMWAYPFQILANYQVGFRPSGSNAIKDGRQLLRRVDYRPDSVTRTYIGPDFLVREKLFVPINEAAAVLSYTIEGIRPVDINVHFSPVLNLMWPGGLGGQYTRWKPAETSSGVPGFVIAGQGNDLAGIIGSREITAHDDTVNTALLTEHGFSFLLHPVGNKATVYIELNPVDEDASAALGKLAARLPQLEADEAAHYVSLEADSLRIHTPNEEVNRSLAWAKAAIDQAWVCNPRLGCGIVAGYGPSRDALRPQYAWFFGGDGLITTNALVSAGEYTRAREELTFIQKYQDKTNGMIWHELSQSAGYMDWRKLPFMFVHVDITFDYLGALARYVLTSGDTAFANQSWASIAAAYRYCQSSIGPDHLPHIPADKEASDEQHRPADDLSLSVSWMTAAAGYAELARLTGHSAEAVAAMQQVELTRGMIASHYWNAAAHYWYDGHTSSGEPIYREAVGPAQVIGTSVFSPEQDKALLDRLTSADFQADWGTREVAATATDYNPYSYGAGSVSPVSTLAAAIGMWQAHRPESAYAIWQAVLQWNTFDSMGHVHEVLAGNFYQEQTESVAEQTWSSAALFDATVRGLFGLTINAAGGAAGRSLTLAPHLPPAWSRVSLENVRLGSSTLAFTISQATDSLDLDIENQGPPTTVLFNPRIPLGAQLLSARFMQHKVDTAIESLGSDEHLRVTLDVPSGESHLHLAFAGGISISLASEPLQVGAASTAPKIVSVHLDGKVLQLACDVNAGHDAILSLRTPWKIVEHPGATVRPLAENEYEVRIAASPTPATASSTDGYRPARISLRLQ
jgi:glycogen debranching enzyme